MDFIMLELYQAIFKANNLKKDFLTKIINSGECYKEKMLPHM